MRPVEFRDPFCKQCALQTPPLCIVVFSKRPFYAIEWLFPSPPTFQGGFQSVSIKTIKLIATFECEIQIPLPETARGAHGESLHCSCQICCTVCWFRSFLPKENSFCSNHTKSCKDPIPHVQGAGLGHPPGGPPQHCEAIDGFVLDLPTFEGVSLESQVLASPVGFQWNTTGIPFPWFLEACCSWGNKLLFPFWPWQVPRLVGASLGRRGLLGRSQA